MRKVIAFITIALGLVVPALLAPPASAHSEYHAFIGTCAIDGGSGYGRIQHDAIYSTSHASTSVGAGNTDNEVAIANYTNRTLQVRVRTYVDGGTLLYNSGWWTLGPPEGSVTSKTIYLPLLSTADADDWFHYSRNPRSIVDFVAAGGGDAQLVSWWKAVDHGGTVTCNGLD